VTGSSDHATSSELDGATAFDELAKAAASGRISRRQLTQLGGAVALSAMLPSGARGGTRAAQLWARMAEKKTTGTCPQQKKEKCPGDLPPRPWTRDCMIPVPNGHTSSFNGCGPQGGVHLPVVGTGDYVPDEPLGIVNFFGPCKGHDCCYGRCGSDKDDCDGKFLIGMLDVCDTTWPVSESKWQGILDVFPTVFCRSLAATYYSAVHYGGQDAYDSGQKEVCDCCDCDPGFTVRGDAVDHGDSLVHGGCEGG
jgi:hypothetical protein